MPATYEDAALILQIVRWGTEMGIDDAGQAVFASDFDVRAASVDDSPVGKLLSFYETVGTLVKHDILDKDLVLDLWWVKGTSGPRRAGCSSRAGADRRGAPL